MPAGLLLPPRQAEALLGLAQPELRTQCLVSRAAGLVMQMSVLFPTNSRSPQSAWRSPEALVRQSQPLLPVSQLQGRAGQGAPRPHSHSWVLWSVPARWEQAAEKRTAFIAVHSRCSLIASHIPSLWAQPIRRPSLQASPSAPHPGSFPRTF